MDSYKKFIVNESKLNESSDIIELKFTYDEDYKEVIDSFLHSREIPIYYEDSYDNEIGIDIDELNDSGWSVHAFKRQLETFLNDNEIDDYKIS